LREAPLAPSLGDASFDERGQTATLHCSSGMRLALRDYGARGSIGR
jgi:hypothetical protein